jgi:hypothetical protein
LIIVAELQREELALLVLESIRLGGQDSETTARLWSLLRLLEAASPQQIEGIAALVQVWVDTPLPERAKWLP